MDRSLIFLQSLTVQLYIYIYIKMNKNSFSKKE